MSLCQGDMLVKDWNCSLQVICKHTSSLLDKKRPHVPLSEMISDVCNYTRKRVSPIYEIWDASQDLISRVRAKSLSRLL